MLNKRPDHTGWGLWPKDITGVRIKDMLWMLCLMVICLTVGAFSDLDLTKIYFVSRIYTQVSDCRDLTTYIAVQMNNLKEALLFQTWWSECHMILLKRNTFVSNIMCFKMDILLFFGNSITVCWCNSSCYPLAHLRMQEHAWTSASLWSVIQELFNKVGSSLAAATAPSVPQM